MKLFTLFLFLAINICLHAQTEYNEFIERLSSISNKSEKSAVVDSFMNYATLKGIPFIEGDTATFLYRGTHVTYNSTTYPLYNVFIYGDINYGGEFSLELKKIKDTDLFALRYYFEQNARLDYNYVLNGLVMITDPKNPNKLPWGRIGQVSELAMPGYEQPSEIVFHSEIPHGTSDLFTLQNTANSIVTGHQVIVRLPAGYDKNSDERYPVAYFHDGPFYIAAGSAYNILDNLIYENKIKPIIGVFVNYSPGNRTKEYVFESDRFVDFFNNILVPHIDEKYKTIADGENRAVIGLSFGGNISALIVNSVKDMYKNCGLHSGAIWPVDFLAAKSIYKQSDWNIKYYMVWGSYEPKLRDVGRMVRDSLDAKGYTNYKWGEYPQGHSMGFWRGTTDIFLEYFFPPENTTSIQESNDKILSADFYLNQNYPNPFNPETKITYTLNHGGFVKLIVYDMLGRKIKTLLNNYRASGTHSEIFDASEIPSGNYFYSMQFGGKFVVKKMTLIK